MDKDYELLISRLEGLNKTREELIVNLEQQIEEYEKSKKQLKKQILILLSLFAIYFILDILSVI